MKSYNVSPTNINEFMDTLEENNLTFDDEIDEIEQREIIISLKEAREIAAKKAWDITLALDKARQLVERIDEDIARESNNYFNRYGTKEIK